MATLSTHILDIARGRPAAGVLVALETSEAAHVARGTTDEDGRIGALGDRLMPGAYVLRFATGAYLGPDAFYPEVVVGFRIGTDEHYHVPLLLSPYGYSTYRGS
jgi:5-hydroxyisourate hydrolase